MIAKKKEIAKMGLAFWPILWVGVFVFFMRKGDFFLINRLFLNNLFLTKRAARAAVFATVITAAGIAIARFLVATSPTR